MREPKRTDKAVRLVRKIEVVLNRLENINERERVILKRVRKQKK